MSTTFACRACRTPIRRRSSTPQRVGIGAPLLRVDKGAVRARIEALPWVEKADVETKLPGTLRITVHERVPVAYVRRDDTHVAVLAADGHVITDLPAPLDGLVEVRGAAKVPAGRWHVATGRRGRSRARAAAGARDARRGAIDVAGDSVKLALSTGGEVRLCSPGDLAAKGAAAVAVIARLGTDTVRVHRRVRAVVAGRGRGPGCLTRVSARAAEGVCFRARAPLQSRRIPQGDVNLNLNLS